MTSAAQKLRRLAAERLRPAVFPLENKRRRRSPKISAREYPATRGDEEVHVKVGHVCAVVHQRIHLSAVIKHHHSHQARHRAPLLSAEK